MKFTCPRCNEQGVGATTYFFDDFRKKNTCKLCEAPLLRRHYFSSTVFHILFGGGIIGYIALFVSWAGYRLKGLMLCSLALLAISLISRLLEIPFTKIEDADSEKTKKRNKRNDRILKVFLWLFLALAVYSIYEINK